MTDPKPDDPKALRDADFDAAWRAASREEPPASLDAAIAAAARRAVGAGPARIGERDAPTARARKAWWPLAAAATVAALTVGVLQLVTSDRLGAPVGTQVAVSDMPATAPAPRGGEAPRAEAGSAVGGDERAGAATDERSAEPPAAAPSPLTGAAPARRKDEAAARAGALPEPSPRAGALPEPFPRAGARPEPLPAAPERRAAVAAAPATPASPAAIAAGELASVPAAVSPPAATGALRPPPPPTVAAEGTAPQRDALARNRAPAAAAPIAAPAVPAPPAAQHAEAPPGAARPALAAKTAAATGASGVASGVASDAAREKLRAPLPVADWIALIRRLRTEGRVDDAAKELAAFRAAHADHERLLPPDLRDWQPSAK